MNNSFLSNEEVTLMRLSLAGGIITLLSVVAATYADDTKEELKKLAGTWTLESRLSNESEFKQAKALQYQVRIEGDKWTVLIKGKGSDSDTIVIDPSKDPKTIDRTGKRTTQYGIYKLEGDTLTVAFGPPKGKRPEKFESPKGSNVILSVYKRAK
jgi:uncharacterized protein (TIGR03067 family)